MARNSGNSSSSSRRGDSGSGEKRRRRKSDASPPANTLSAELVFADDDLLKHILVRLPAKPLFRFKQVSPRWRSLISDPQLLLDWKPPKSDSVLFIRRYSSPDSTNIKFNYVPLCPENGAKKKSVRTLSSSVNECLFGVQIIRSCKGLLLCSSSSSSRSDRYFVHNPTTKQFAPVPRPPVEDQERNFIVSMDLAFDPSVSLEYKVLAVRRKWQGPDNLIDVYSSDTEKWTTTGKPFTVKGNIVFESGVFLNDKIHWPSRNTETSILYDFGPGEVLPMPMPLLTFGYWRELLHFGQSGGRLRLIQFPSCLTRQFNVFEMETDYSSWFVKYHVDLELGIGPFLPDTLPRYVLCFVGGGEEGDSSFLLYIDGKIISYNFKDKSFSKICDLKLCGCDLNNVRLVPWLTIHPCMETLFPV